MLSLHEAHEALDGEGANVLIVIPAHGWVNLTQGLHNRTPHGADVPQKAQRVVASPLAVK